MACIALFQGECKPSNPGLDTVRKEENQKRIIFQLVGLVQSALLARGFKCPGWGLWFHVEDRLHVSRVGLRDVV